MFTVKDIRALKPKQELNSGNGFIARGNSNNTVSFIVKKKLRGQKSPLSRTIFNVPQYDSNLQNSIIKATSIAMSWITLMSQGIDPKEKEKEDKQTKDTQSITLNELLTKYELSRESFDIGNAPRTMKDRRNTLWNVFKDWFDKPVKNITKNKIMDRYNEWASGQTNKRPQAQKAIRYIRSVLNYGKDTLDIIDKNPCDIFKGKIAMKNKMDTKQYLKPSETKLMLRYINSFLDYKGNNLIKEFKIKSESLFLVKKFEDKDETSESLLQIFNAIKLILYSGLRLNEVLQLKWKQVHLNGTEINPNPYFEIIKSKQNEPFGIPITESMSPIFDRQKMIQSLITDGEQKNYDYVFSSYATSSKPITTVRQGFETLNQLIPELISADKIGANQLRHTFATMAFSLGYAMSEIDSLTGHGITGRSNVATDAYVGRVADDNRKAFERIHNAFEGELIRDNEVIEISDSVDLDIKANPNKIMELYDRGLLTKEEQKKYNVDAKTLEKTIKIEEDKLKDNDELPPEMLKARQEHIEDMKEVYKRLIRGN
jgi:integrase